MKKIFLLLILLPCILLPAVNAAQRLEAESIQTLLEPVVKKVIVPVYQELDSSAQNLAAQSAEFCANPDITGLQKVRQHWSETLSLWQQSSPFLFGPVVEDQLDFSIYFLPVKKNVINKLLRSEGTITTELLEKLGVGGHGLATLEYLLYDRELQDKDLLTHFSGTDGKQRCDYLIQASKLLSTHITQIVSAWTAEGDKGYATAMLTAEKGSTQFVKAYQPLELLVNRMYQTIQFIEIKKLGVTLGIRGSRSGPPRTYPYKLEAWRSGHSLQNIKSGLFGLQRIFEDGELLNWLRANQHTALADKISGQLQALYTTEFASDDLFTILQNEPDSIRPFYDAIREFSGTIRNDLAPALLIQLGFNENDGD